MGIKDDLVISSDWINIAPVEATTACLNIQAVPVRMPDFKPRTNCINCGAPLDMERDCPYCGTKRQMVGGIFQTADSISCFVG